MSWNPKWKQFFMNCHPDCFSQSATILMDSGSLQFLGKAASVLPNIQTVQMWHSSTGQKIHTWHPKVSDLWNVPVAYHPDSSSSTGFPWGTDHVTLFSWKNNKCRRKNMACHVLLLLIHLSIKGILIIRNYVCIYCLYPLGISLENVPCRWFTHGYLQLPETSEAWLLWKSSLKASVPRLFRFWASCTHLYRGLDRSQNRQNPNFDSNFLLAMPIDYWDVLICPPNGNVNWNKMIHHEILSYCTLCPIAFRQTHSLGSQCPSEAAATRILMPLVKLVGNKCQF